MSFIMINTLFKSLQLYMDKFFTNMGKKHLWLGPIFLPLLLLLLLWCNSTELEFLFKPVNLLIVYLVATMTYHMYQTKLFDHYVVSCFVCIICLAIIILVFLPLFPSLYSQSLLMPPWLLPPYETTIFVAFALLYVIFIFTSIITNNNKALNDFLSLFVEVLIISTISFFFIIYEIKDTDIVYPELTAIDVTTIFIVGYFLIKIIISSIALGFSKKSQSKRGKDKNQAVERVDVVAYLFGKREELDKVLSLLITSAILLFLFVPTIANNDNNLESEQLLSINIIENNSSIVTVNVRNYEGDISEQMPMLIEHAFEKNPLAKSYIIKQEADSLTISESFEQVLLLFIVWSLFLLILSWAKYILRFDRRNEKLASANMLQGSKYHRGYFCDKSKHEYVKCKILDDLPGKKYKFLEPLKKTLVNARMIQESKYHIFDKSKNNRLDGIPLERYSYAIYEINRLEVYQAFRNDDLMRGEQEGVINIPKEWKDLLDKIESQSQHLDNYCSDDFKHINPKLLNDYCAITMNNHYCVTENNGKYLYVDKKQKIESMLKCAMEGEAIAKYNLYLFYRKQNKKSEHEIRRYIQEAKDEGYLPAIRLYEQDLDKNYEDMKGKTYRSASSEATFEKLYEDRYTKPIEIFVSVLRLIFLLVSVYLTMEIMQHSEAENVGLGLGSLGILGLGLGLIFKESLYSFFAGVRIYLDDLARVGDKVSLDSLDIYGRVYNFTLTNITIKNFDSSLNHMSLTTYLESSVKNWRLLDGVKGRRIKRSIIFDVRSIKRYHGCDNANKDLFERLFKLEYLKKYITCKAGSFNNKNKDCSTEDNLKVVYESLLLHEEGCYPNKRFLTNIGLFREYVGVYLYDHEYIDSKANIVVSQKELTPSGLPIQILAYTPSSSEFTSYKNFKNLQSDIFEHILVVARYFELELYQSEKDDGHLEYKDKSIICGESSANRE